MPLAQRLPKLPGFKNPFKKVYTVVNVSKLKRFPDGSKVDAAALTEAGLVRAGVDVKVLGTGALDRKLTVIAHAFSSSAREAIEARGGTVTVIGEPRKIGPRRLAAKTAKRTIKEEDSAPRSGEDAPKARVGRNEKPETEESSPPKES